MVPDIAKAGHSFKGAMAYFLHDKGQDATGRHLETSARVAWTETRNMLDVGPQTATRIMIATASQADELKAAAGVKNTGRKSNAHVYSYSLAWHPDEAGKLDRAEMQRAVDGSLKALGADQHQAVIVCHRDQKHPHVHVVVNRVHPETGKMLSTGNDRLKLSDWANAYERERGQILTPAREEKRLYAQQFDRAARKDHVDRERDSQAERKARSTPPPPTPGQSRAARAKELTDALRARHREEWPKLSERNTAARTAIYDDFRAKIDATKARHKESTRGVWAEHFRQSRADLAAFADREKTIGGVIRNAIDAAKVQMASGKVPDRGRLAPTFSNVLSSQARTAALADRRELSRGELARALKGELDKELHALKQQRGTALAGQRKTFDADRAALIERQKAERVKIGAVWRDVYTRRGKDPRHVPARVQEAAQRHRQRMDTRNRINSPDNAARIQMQERQQMKTALKVQQKAAAQPEQKPVKRDFDKSAQLPVANLPPVPTVTRHLSTPAPAPSPAGVPVPPPRQPHQVPLLDKAKEFAKSLAAKVTTQENAPTPPVRQQFQETRRTPAPTPASPKPQSRADMWRETAKQITGQQPEPSRPTPQQQPTRAAEPTPTPSPEAKPQSRADMWAELAKQRTTDTLKPTRDRDFDRER